jgi:predicted transcriptional regulator
VADVSPIQGELQAQIMPALWRIGEGSVEQVRSALPKRYRSAYTTVQTVLNRLAERGLLVRERRGNTIYYRPRVSEADYLSRTIAQTLAGASAEARQAALAQLFGSLAPAEREELQSMAERIASRRRRR